MSGRPDLSMSRAEIVALVQRPLRAVLATIGPGGFPHATGMFYVPGRVEGPLELFLWGYAKSQKVMNLRRNPRCAVVIEDGEPYVDLRGVMVTGKARILDSYETSYDVGVKLYERYLLPRTGVVADSGPAGSIAGQAHKRVVIAVDEQRVASWDHGKSGT